MGNTIPSSRDKATTEFWWTFGMINLSIFSVVATDYLITNGASVLSSIAGITLSKSSQSFLSYETLRPLASYGHFAVGLPVVIASLFIKSPYGRHAVKAVNEGQTLPAVVSWMIQESPTLIAFFYFNIKYGFAPVMSNPATILFMAHYINRTFVFPLLLGKGTPQRVWVTFSALSYCVFNGLLQTGVDASSSPSIAQRKGGNTSVITSIVNNLDNPSVAALGFALFTFGMTCNIIADRHLISLKEKHNTYVIPRHLLFQQISCPNFFFETVEWLGFTVATAGCTGLSSSQTLAAASFCFFTACNTWMRAIQHHQWYHEKFGDEYKKLNRKAVVPFLL